MVVVLLVLPSLYMIFDPVIMKTTIGMQDARKYDKERRAAWEIEHAEVTAQ